MTKLLTKVVIFHPVENTREIWGLLMRVICIYIM